MVLKMLEEAGSCTWKYVIPLLKAGVILIMSVPKEVEGLKKEWAKIRVLIREADRAAAAAKDFDKRKGYIERATKLRTINFRIEDVMEEWNSCLLLERANGMKNVKGVDEEQPRDHRCVALPCESANNIVSIQCCDRLKIALKIQQIKQDLGEIKEGSEIDQGGSSSSAINPDDEWKNLGRNPIYMGQTEIVGFEAASDKLVGWLEDGRAECSVMVVVGMAGQGKTTLAQEIFHNEEVIRKFKYSPWINVSDFDAADKFFRSMLLKLYKQADKRSLPHGFPTMGLKSLKNEVEKLLRKERYVLFFDDVWNKNFWPEIERTVCHNGNGSRIIITTRNKEVAAETRRKSDSVDVEVHEMQPLTERQSLELFCQTVSRFRMDRGLSQRQIEILSSEIFEKCGGLPLGIVNIGKHVSAHIEDAFTWKSKIKEAGITGILCLSYDNLPHHLEACLLYFGIYPQDCEIKSKRLIRQWIAEGFVEYEMGKTLEEVAEGYLASLIDRNLVQVSSFTIDDKPRTCRVHYLVHDMILRKFEDISFCRCINEDNEPDSDMSGITRRLSIATNPDEELPGFFNGLADKIESPFIRSLHFFTREQLPEHLARRIPAKQRPLKVVDFENSGLSRVPEDLGNLIYLKYLSFRNTQIQRLPESIGKLQNLETLDLRQTGVEEMPKEVSNLTKLRHLLGLVQLKIGIGGMRFLKTLGVVKMDDGADLIEKELGKLWQIRDLRLTNVGEEHRSALCSSINKMKHLEKLHIVAKSGNDVIDLQGLRKPSKLLKLRLEGKLNTLPTWVRDLGRLKLVLSCSKLTDDQLNPLKDISSLLFLSIINEAYEGGSLHFQEGGFENLEELELGFLHSLSAITIHSKALPSLKKLKLRDIPQLKRVPSGMQHLEELEDLDIQNMPTEFEQSIVPNGGQGHQTIKHVRRVRINGELVKD